MPLWQHSSDRSSLMAVPNTTQLLHWVPLVKPRRPRQATVLQTPLGALWVSSRPRGSLSWCMAPSPGEQNPWSLQFVLTTPEHRGLLSGHQRLFKATGEHELKRRWSALVIMRLMHTSRLCALLPNYNLRKYSDHEWDWWILGDFSTSILGAKLLASCPKLASQPKTEFRLKSLLFFLPRSSFHLPHSL